MSMNEGPSEQPFKSEADNLSPGQSIGIATASIQYSIQKQVMTVPLKARFLAISSFLDVFPNNPQGSSTKNIKGILKDIFFDGGFAILSDDEAQVYKSKKRERH